MIQNQDLKQFYLLEQELQTGQSPPLLLTLGDTEYYIPRSEILFFETDGQGRITAHTAKHLYYTAYRLFELERLLPVHAWIYVLHSI